MKRYDVLLFDADNTLLDFDANEKESFRCLMRDMGEDWTEERYRTYKTMNDALWKKIERREISVEEGVNTRFAAFMERYGKQVDGRAWERVYRSYLNRGTQEMPYVHQVLARLQKEFRLYVITNGVEETQVFRMNGAGLTGYFQDMFISGRIGCGKPSREFFAYVEAHIPDFRKETALVIGDSLTSDIQGGHDARLDTCWLVRQRDARPEDVQPDYIIHSLLQLADVLGIAPFAV